MNQLIFDGEMNVILQQPLLQKDSTTVCSSDLEFLGSFDIGSSQHSGAQSVDPMADPGYTAPAYTAPAYTDPATDPVYTNSAYTDPAMDPGYTNPACTDTTAYMDAAYSNPGFTDPGPMEFRVSGLSFKL